MPYSVRVATPDELDAMLELLPRLAAFDLPASRAPEDLWHGDAELLRQWAAGTIPNCLVHIAVDANGLMLGVAIARLRGELLSGAPSAHLEVLVVREGAEGQRIGPTLLASIEQAVRERGALSMSLHVFASNTRARAVYARAGYTDELIRYIRHFE